MTPLKKLLVMGAAFFVPGAIGLLGFATNALVFGSCGPVGRSSFVGLLLMVVGLPAGGLLLLSAAASVGWQRVKRRRAEIPLSITS